MDSKTSANEQPRRSSRLKLVLKIGFGGFAAIFLFLLLGVGIPIAREISRPIAVPKFEKMADKLLVPADPRGAEKIPATVAANKNDAAVTTQTAASPYSVSSTTSSLALRFKPLIPDAPDLPVNIRAARESINARFDKLLIAIENYEKQKADLNYAEARKILDDIYKTNREIWDQITKLHGVRWRMDGWTGEVERRNQTYQKWRYAAEVEVNAKGSKWHEAAGYSELLFGYKRYEWENKLVQADPNRPVFRSDFYREDPEDWDRMMYCYRQVRGGTGYERIIERVWYRKKREFLDGVSRAVWNAGGR